MLTVHRLENSRSERVLWLPEEPGVPYQVRRYARDPQSMLAPPELRAVHPLGKSPVVTDDGRTIAETGAIAEYLVGRYGAGALIPPADTDKRLRYTYWPHFAEGLAMPPLVMTLTFRRLPNQVPALVRPPARAIAKGVAGKRLAPRIAAQLDLMESELRRSAWFVGDAFRAAGVMMSFPVEAAANRVGLGARERLADWLARIHARPACQRALAQSGPYAYAA